MMNYFPDGELCLIVIESPETEPDGSGAKPDLWSQWMRTDEQRSKDMRKVDTIRRNKVKESEARSAIKQAKKDRYKPLYSRYNKDRKETTLLGIKRKKGWESINAKSLMDRPHTSKIQSFVSSLIGKPNGTGLKKLHKWESALSIYQAKPQSQSSREGSQDRSRRDNRDRNQSGGDNRDRDQSRGDNRGRSRSRSRYGSRENRPDRDRDQNRDKNREPSTEGSS